MTKLRTALTTAAALAALAFTTNVEAMPGGVHVRGSNGSATAVAGKRGVAGRAGGVTTSEDGTVTRGSVGGFAGANGSTGARASTTSVSPDGTVSHQGAAGTSGARGSAYSEGSFTKNADGTTSGSRTSSATNNATGNSYSGSTTVDNGQVSHTGTCTNASGEVIACR